MALPEILKTKNPKDFGNYLIAIERENNNLYAKTYGTEMNFPKMMEYRMKDLFGLNDSTPKIPIEKIPEYLNKKINEGGFLFANLGISVSLTTTIDNKNYAIVVKQDRSDLGDSVAKLISGYVDSKHITHPLMALDEEMSEEFLICNQNGKILSGMRNLNLIPKAFKETAEYDEKVAYQMIESDFFKMPNLTKDNFHIYNKKINPNPGIYFQIPSNSAQMVFSYHIDIPRIPNKEFTINHAEINYLEDKTANINHAEDKFNPKNNSLDVTLHKEGLLLIELENNNLTDKVYTFKEGNLIPHSNKILLSEAFAPKQEGFVLPKSISLSKYLKTFC